MSWQFWTHKTCSIPQKFKKNQRRLLLVHWLQAFGCDVLFTCQLWLVSTTHGVWIKAWLALSIERKSPPRKHIKTMQIRWWENISNLWHKFHHLTHGNKRIICGVPMIRSPVHVLPSIISLHQNNGWWICETMWNLSTFKLPAFTHISWEVPWLWLKAHGWARLQDARHESVNRRSKCDRTKMNQAYDKAVFSLDFAFKTWDFSVFFLSFSMHVYRELHQINAEQSMQGASSSAPLAEAPLNGQLKWGLH